MFPVDNLLKREVSMEKITVLYCRTSTNKQETGLESQKRALLEYCERMGIVNFEVFSDDGISGTKTKRPALDKILEHIENNQVEKVIVYSFSRMARSTMHLLEMLDLLKSKNVGFVSITEQVSTENAYGKMLYTLIASFAELERSLVVERVKCGLQNAKKKGVTLGRKKTRPSKLIRELLILKKNQSEIAKLCNIGRASVYREVLEMEKEKSFYCKI
jgi:DNA invertase Pin-like site-specific DNA recombinase